MNRVVYKVVLTGGKLILRARGHRGAAERLSTLYHVDLFHCFYTEIKSVIESASPVETEILLVLSDEGTLASVWFL